MSPILRNLEMHQKNAFIQVDFDTPDAGALDVSRSVLMVSKKADPLINYVYEKYLCVMHKYLFENSSSIFAAINSRMVGTNSITILKPYWPIENHSDNQEIYPAILASVNFPAASSSLWKYNKIPKKLTWKKRPIFVFSGVRNSIHDEHYEGLLWQHNTMDFDRILLEDCYGPKTLIPIWEKNPYNNSTRKSSFLSSCLFPPVWKNLVGVSFCRMFDSSRVFWNKNNKFFQCVTKEAWEWAKQISNCERFYVEFRDKLLNDMPCASAWLLRMLQTKSADLWNGIIERDSDFAQELWNNFRKRSRNTVPNALLLWEQDSYSSKLRIISPHGWKDFSHHDSKEIDKWLPDPGYEWTVSEVSE